MRTLQNPSAIGIFGGLARRQRGLPPLTPQEREAAEAKRKLRVEGGNNPNKFQQAVRNSKRPGETFGQSAKRLGSAGLDTFGGN